uniref:Uncharacterized protein n=1 Tax=Aegilops tauschii subsp. strangulata TaxID=200361 RepID=A0A453RPR8_AEGTS
ARKVKKHSMAVKRAQESNIPDRCRRAQLSSTLLVAPSMHIPLSQGNRRWSLHWHSLHTEKRN